MSFSHDAKLEVLSQPFDNDCCWLAFLSGLLRSCGELSVSKGIISADIVTDIEELYDFVNIALINLYGDKCELEITDDYLINRKTYYRISMPVDISTQVLQDTGIVERGESGGPVIAQQTPSHLLIEEHCKRAYIKGVFVGCATTNIKISEEASQKTSSGYHLEFTSHNKEFLEEFSKVLADFLIPPKIIERKNGFVAYLKEAGQVSDVLALVGANISVLELQNEICAREIRNRINRETNCFSANISKTVEASFNQIEAIEKINRTRGLETLPQDLQDIALLRLANQEESLEELLKLSTLPLTKSGLNHRFRKLIKIAKEIEE